MRDDCPNPTRVLRRIVSLQLKLRSKHGGISGRSRWKEYRIVVGVACISAIGDEFRVADPQLELSRIICKYMFSLSEVSNVCSRFSSKNLSVYPFKLILTQTFRTQYFQSQLFGALSRK